MEQTYSIEIIQPSDLENLSTQDNVIELTDVGIIGLDSLCRLCANRSDHLIPIYDGEGLDYQLEAKINRHFPFSVERTDTLPTHCCYQCASTLLTWHELIETSIEADRRLKALEFDTVVQFNHKLENLEEPAAPEEVIPDETTEIYEEAQETENISDVSTNDQQRVAQLRAAAVTAGRLLSFRQAQSNFTVDYLNQSNTTKLCTTSENLKETQKLDIKIEPKTEELIPEPKREELSSEPKIEELSQQELPTSRTKIKRKVKTLKQKTSRIYFNYLQISDKLISNDKLVKIQTNKSDKLVKTKINNSDKLVKIQTNKSNKLAKTQTNNSDKLINNDKLAKTQTNNSDKLINNDKLAKINSNDNDKLAKTQTKNDETNNEYLCVFCDEIFSSKKLLNAHKYEKHSVDEKCRIINKDEIDNARVIIDKRVYYQCKECGKNLHSPYTYMWHRRIHTGERPYVCDLCGKQFRVSQGLVRHLRETHAGIKNFPCDICGRMFGTRRNVDEHRRIHTNERPYVCALCGKSFKQKASLFVHTRSHSDNFPHKCTYCGQGFRTKAPLLIHVTRHTGEKPYSCEICGRCFRIKYELKGHKLIHSDVKPFHCAVCGISFRQKRYLRNHNKVKHNINNNSNNQTVP